MEKMPIDQTDSAAPVPAGKRGERKIDREKLRKACGDFEALLVDRMLEIDATDDPPDRIFGQ